VCSNELLLYICTYYDINNYYIIIALAPEITELPLNVKTFDGSTTTIIKCKPYGVPKPHVKWIKNDIELTGGRYSTLDNGDLQLRSVKKYIGFKFENIKPNLYFFIFSKVSFIDAGIYTCIATNNYGTASASGILTVKGVQFIVYILVL